MEEQKCNEPEVRGYTKNRKRDQVVVGVADALGIQLSGDVLSLDEMKDFPNLAKESERSRAIMALHACGFRQTHIAQIFGVKQPTIHEIIRRIDPHGMFKSSNKARKAIMTSVLEGNAMSALASITMDELMELDASKRTETAAKMLKMSQDLNATKHKEIDGGRMDALLAQMAAESEDADFEPIEGEGK